MRVLLVATLIGFTIFILTEATKSVVGPPASLRGKNNLIFITVDTLRADHTPFGDYERSTMPATAEFFQDGLNFVQTETIRTTTVPSYAAILSGLYPYHNGVRNNFAQ